MFKANGNWFATYSFDRLTDGSPLGMMDELFDEDNNNNNFNKNNNININDGVTAVVGGQSSLRKRVEKSGSGVCMVFAD